MKLTTINFSIPEDIIAALNKSRSEFTSEMRLLTAIQLFKAHKLSIGKSAALAGIRKEHFLTYLDQYRVPVIDYNADELEGELKRFKQ